MYTDVINKIGDDNYRKMVNLRHQFHMYPERGYEEFKTAKTISDELERLGIDYKANVAKTGVVGLIKGNHPGKTVLLRADMDALPINEEADVEYKSRIENCMHACGHDGHMAGVLGAAMILNNMKDEIYGNVKLIFQPAEEEQGGAKPMIDEGVMDNPKVDAAFGCHLWGGMLEGEVHVRKGPMMAAPDMFRIKIKGKGGHGAVPHLTIDPIVIASQVINNIQSIVSRRISPLESAVISFGSIQGGKSHNVIPNDVELVGTVRTFSEENRKFIPKAMEDILKAVTESQGAGYEFKYEEKYPALINDEKMTEIAKNSFKKIVGEDKVVDMKEPTMGGEDFAYFGQLVPASFMFVGISKDKDNLVVHHHPKFKWDDKNILTIAKGLAQTAIDYLKA
ncbi:M20 metallopeptidase family protein [Tepidibacter hydrothermalis]|uniref:Amidohydrolase n=1 Tax=Tepidibacter hydrothermalis TaxID=3036126 RepID=A0ABY8EC71_9FIRM|nr:amidohydrolase [Tepidibacter hydrothermalis]WFD10537.1 amidohydrolase [Tepidibacter hydrothermalis]